jgi:hypothetical protein
MSGQPIVHRANGWPEQHSSKELTLPTSLDRDQLLRLARLGAGARLDQLQAEIAALRKAFPELSTGAGAATRKRGRRRASALAEAARAVGNAQSSTGDQEQPRKAGRRGWTVAQRREAAERMKAYWAKRKSGRTK